MEDLRSKEKRFVSENFQHVSERDGFLYAVYEGNAGSLETLLESYLLLTPASFVRSQTHYKSKNHKRYSTTAHPVFEDNKGHIPITFFGNPFTIESTEIRHCLHGPLKDSRGGTKKRKGYGEHDYGSSSKTYQKFQGSRKRGCPAAIQIRGTNVYNNVDYTIQKSSCPTANSLKMAKKNVLERLQRDLSGQSNITIVSKYYVRLPMSTVHKGHVLGSPLEKINELVGGNVTQPNEVKRDSKGMDGAEVVQREVDVEDLQGFASDGDKPVQLSKLRESLLEKLSFARDCVYKIEDPQHLQEVLVYADKIYDYLSYNCPTKQGLPIRLSDQLGFPSELKVESTDIQPAQVDPNIPIETNGAHSTLSPRSADVNETTSRFVDPVERLHKSETPLRETLLVCGSVNVTPLDLWTIVPPEEIPADDLKQIRNGISKFEPGWLTDAVIDAFLWSLAEQSNSSVLAADSVTSQTVYNASINRDDTRDDTRHNTKRTWCKRSFTNTKIILFPINFTGQHWTLLAFDKSNKKRLYLDPIECGDPIEGGDSLAKIQPLPMRNHIKKLSKLVDRKAGWNSSEWRCRRPPHCQQRDTYNCGVYVCFFAECLALGLDMNKELNMNTERKRIFETLWK